MNNAFIARRIISTHDKYNSVNLRIFFKIESFTFFASISLQTTYKHTTKLTYSKIIVTWNILIRQTVLKWSLAFKYHRTYWLWLIFFVDREGYSYLFSLFKVRKWCFVQRDISAFIVYLFLEVIKNWITTFAWCVYVVCIDAEVTTPASKQW